MYIVLFPPNTAPDEHSHIATAYYDANKILFRNSVDEEGYVLVRKTDAQIQDIKAAKEKLMESAQKLFTKMYEQAGAAAGAGAAGPNPGQDAGPAPEGFNGDDVVDGDYKEV